MLYSKHKENGKAETNEKTKKDGKKMNASEIRKSLKENGYDKTLELVIEDSKKGKLSSCFSKSFDYKFFAETRIAEAVK